jgi:Transglycosylase SLT domain/SPOR domain
MAEAQPSMLRAIRQTVKSGGFAVIFSVCFAVNAQLADSDSPSERDVRPADPPLMSATSEEAPSATAPPATAPPGTNFVSICQVVESAASANGLPLEFFAQVIWQESRFRTDAVGPLTRTGHRAQGIAQFMPMTAAERLLHDPFDPIQALPKSAEFLRELRSQFGNLGLAAAAYNAGPQRVRDWLAGRRTLPLETQTYVRKVTGRSAQEWTRPEQAPLTIITPAEVPCAQTATTQAAKPQLTAIVAQQKAASAWGIQLVGDRSEGKALELYRLLQKKHYAILASHEPIIIRTPGKVGAGPIWSRVRIDADNRETAQALCLKLRAAGENCLVQHN